MLSILISLHATCYLYMCKVFLSETQRQTRKAENREVMEEETELKRTAAPRDTSLPGIKAWLVHVECNASSAHAKEFDMDPTGLKGF